MKKSYLERIKELIDYLTLSEVNPNELGRYLTLNTFNFHQTKSVYFLQLNNNGVLSAVDCFGVSDEKLKPFHEIGLNTNFPLAESARTGNILVISDRADWAARYPEFKNVPEEFGWESMITFPIKANKSSIGAMSITFLHAIENDQDLVSFIEAVAGLVALQLLKTPHGRLGSISKNGVGLPSDELLSKRQVEVLNLIADGLTNNQIAKHLGYSESTIRHETMKIYEIFKVRSRKEAVIFAHSRKLIRQVGLLIPLLIFNLGNQLELAITELPLIGI